jgi:hypothetical protein
VVNIAWRLPTHHSTQHYTDDNVPIWHCSGPIRCTCSFNVNTNSIHSSALHHSASVSIVDVDLLVFDAVALSLHFYNDPRLTRHGLARRWFMRTIAPHYGATQIPSRFRWFEFAFDSSNRCVEISKFDGSATSCDA